MIPRAIISGLNTLTQLNGEYVYSGIVEGDVTYIKGEGNSSIVWKESSSSPIWSINAAGIGPVFVSSQDTAYPWQVTEWTPTGIDPGPVTITEVEGLSSNTNVLFPPITEAGTARMARLSALRPL